MRLLINGVDIVALYKAGHPVREVARRAGLSETTARRRLHAAGVAMRPPGTGTSPATVTTCSICGLPLEGHPCCQICGILMGPGHEEQGQGSVCRGCRAPRVEPGQISTRLLRAIEGV